MGHQAVCTNQAIVPAATKAVANCTPSKRPRRAWAKAATPPGVNGCQAILGPCDADFIKIRQRHYKEAIRLSCRILRQWQKWTRGTLFLKSWPTVNGQAGGDAGGGAGGCGD